MKYLITSLLIICQLLTSNCMLFSNGNITTTTVTLENKYAHYIIEGKNTVFEKNDYPLDEMINYLENNTYKMEYVSSDTIYFYFSEVSEKMPNSFIVLRIYQDDNKYFSYENFSWAVNIPNKEFIVVDFYGYCIETYGEMAFNKTVELLEIKNIELKPYTGEPKFKEINEDVSIYKLKKFCETNNYKIYYDKNSKFDFYVGINCLYVVDEYGALKYLYMNGKIKYEDIGALSLGLTVLSCNNTTILAYETNDNYQSLINSIRY